MKQPNFFIVGAPKCATTALYEYLRTHPNVFMPPKMKEPCFFSPDFPTRRLVHSMDEYLRLFDEATDQHLAVGEASVWYLYSQVAVQQLHEFNPEAKLIVMLRNPVQQVYAMHMQCYIMEYETETDFIKAWGLQELRKQGKKLPAHCREPLFLQYKDIASYGAQIERLLRTFPRDQVQFVLYDDLKADPRQVYLDVLNFLGLEDDNKKEFAVANPSQRFKIKWLGDVLLKQPTWLQTLKSFIKRTFGIHSLAPIGTFIYKLNVEVGKRPPLRPEFVAELRSEFRDDLMLASSLIGRDLSHWYT